MLCASHNRLLKTLRIIEQLIFLLNHFSEEVDYKLILVDDGSTDKTAEKIKANFSNVTVLKGSGNLFWSGAMRKGYNYIQKQDMSFDYLITFNDDIELDPVGFKKLIEHLLQKYNRRKPCVVSGSFQNFSGETTYGGAVFSRFPLYQFKRNKISGEGKLKQVDVINMNFTAISYTVIERIGFLSQRYRHSKSDFDFGFKANQHNFEVYATNFRVGWCERNPDEGTSREAELPRWVRIRRLLSVKEEPLQERFFFCRTWGGPFWFLWYIRPYLKALINA